MSEMEIIKAEKPKVPKKKTKKKTEKAVRKIDQLNPKHKEFLLNYFQLGMNQRKAYLLTYPKVTKGTADVQACRLLSNPKVAEARQEYLEEQWGKKEEVIAELFHKLKRISSADISEFIDESGNIKVEDFKHIDTFAVAQYDQAVSDTKEGQNVRQSIKMMDKQKSIDTLAKILGMIQDKVEHTGEIIVKPAERPTDED